MAAFFKSFAPPGGAPGAGRRPVRRPDLKLIWRLGDDGRPTCRWAATGDGEA